MTEPYDPAKQMNERLAKEIAKISSAVEVANKEVRARLPERHFREIYLPMFAGDENLKYQVDLQHWINFAGNPYREVDIIDDRSETLFSVPPVFDRRTVNPMTNNRRTLFEVMETASQYARVHPHQGLRYLNSELTERALIMKVPANVVNDLETWNKIFERYGRPPIAPLPATSDNTSAVSNATPSDDFDFEPL